MSTTADPAAGAGRDETMAALFANMVLQQTNMTLMLLGKLPHPETGETACDLEGARLFIDQLEMIEFKTRGNLGPQEERILKQSLAAVRMAFVDAVDHPSASSKSAPARGDTKPEATSAAPATNPPSADSTEEPKKKFSKSY